MRGGRATNRGEKQAWRAWQVPLSLHAVTLRTARASLETVGMRQRDVPLIVQLVEDPRYPKHYRFDDDDVAVYKDAVRLGYISDCRPLAEVA